MFTLSDPLLSLIWESSISNKPKKDTRPTINHISSIKGSYCPITIKAGTKNIMIDDIVIVSNGVSNVKVKLIEVVSKIIKEKILMVNWYAEEVN